MTAQSLPAGFEALEPFVANWALASANDRLRARLDSAAPARVAFFDATKPLIQAGLTYLDAKPLDQFDKSERRLMQLLLSFTHISLAVEIQADDEPRHAEYARTFTITRAPADR